MTLMVYGVLICLEKAAACLRKLGQAYQRCSHHTETEEEIQR